MSTQAKAMPRWKVWARRLFGPRKPKGFWQTRLDERMRDIQDERAGESLFDGFRPALGLMVQLVILLVGMSFVVVFLAHVLIGPVLLSPGLLEHGLADPIGRGLAEVCRVTGQCDLQYLLAGTAFGVLVLVLAGFIVHATVTVTWLEDDADDDTTGDELMDALEAIDERLAHLRSELVIAKVLPEVPGRKVDE